MSVYLFAGGGTAGHVNPLLATADRLREREPDAEILVLGTAEGLEARLVPERGYELVTIPKLPFPRRPNAAALRFPGALKATIDQVRGVIRNRHVDVVFGVGGYAAAPAYLAARAEKTPLAIHEANARPGIANRLGARLTRFVGVLFPSTRLAHARVVGLPLRREVERVDVPAARAEAQALWGLDARRPTLLVTGGSLGARRINETVSTSIAAILGTGWQVLHITGTTATVADPGLAGYRILEYCDRMELALASADFAVSRAGGSTLAELGALGIPSVLVPYAVGNGEQALNARDLVDAGGAVVVSDAEFTPQWVDGALLPLLDDRARVAEMAARAAAQGVRDGADRMVDLLVEARDSRSGSTSAPGVAPHPAAQPEAGASAE
ncbi:UDP-N-acetylglucosamine--N-acetylmuramyl-(pentapeptide) pyrophosphoryl-undecaprenol N-acetylglucosamine transferase [Schumannella soli]|uniref:UDP-N-acetylglucosamine--N-acetylmuramyl-(pentapeptide) pyrophosphoryl-undecaprenol N-acetylglucosamine transferase n=1 Tax=Schumannella soli TaxID=2590779 RepID=A0A506Y381_9MICO|nr:UDP-N-acetylglucosamine--N-acetylmuramyl-(pentapeptide) pyrophosphoryl-undecaprenol N-acetylglucosamine transferase [Schumannella soli]TPW76383.1 UDP-N-acetylglucosamine--N-acetylmuramyl-(pentapeptide) pyrophosphoryl-undecaprenol N-acetylglucosamine transferase [Schumannella soli]